MHVTGWPSAHVLGGHPPSLRKYASDRLSTGHVVSGSAERANIGWYVPPSTVTFIVANMHGHARCAPHVSASHETRPIGLV